MIKRIELLHISRLYNVSINDKNINVTHSRDLTFTQSKCIYGKSDERQLTTGEKEEIKKALDSFSIKG